MIHDAAHAWKACSPKGVGGSNPPPSSTLRLRLRVAGRATGCSAKAGRRADPLIDGAGGAVDGPLFGSKRLCRAGRGGRPRATEEPGSPARPALRVPLTRLTGPDSRQLKNTPMTIMAAKALTSQTKTGTFFNLSMETSCYNRGRRSPGADACQHFMNRRARTAQSHSNPRRPAEGRRGLPVVIYGVAGAGQAGISIRVPSSGAGITCHPRPWWPPRPAAHPAVSPPP